MISGAVSARCVAAACSRCSLVMTSGGGVTLIVSRGGVRSHPAIVANGSDFLYRQRHEADGSRPG